MKLPLFLLVLAALCAWGSFQLGGLFAVEPVVAAERRERPRPAARPHVGAELNARDPAAPVSAPLFRAAVLPAALQAPQPGQSFALVGLAGGAEARVAFLRDEADQHVFSVHVGESVRGWTLERASERCVTLRQGRRERETCLS